jgi:hypothetical protein
MCDAANNGQPNLELKLINLFQQERETWNTHAYLMEIHQRHIWGL